MQIEIIFRTGVDAVQHCDQLMSNDFYDWTFAVMHRIYSIETILAASAAGFGASIITTTGTTTMPTRAGTG